MVSSHHDYTPATRRGFVAGVPTATVGVAFRTSRASRLYPAAIFGE